MAHAHLHRIDPKANMARFYHVDLVPTLFGEVAVLRQWGRIGTNGRTTVETLPSIGEAEMSANRTLRQKMRRGYRQLDPLHLQGDGQLLLSTLDASRPTFRLQTLS